MLTKRRKDITAESAEAMPESTRIDNEFNAVNPDSLAGKNPEYSFGNWNEADNPSATKHVRTYLKQMYGMDNASKVLVNKIVYDVCRRAHQDDLSDYNGSYVEMCRAAVDSLRSGENGAEYQNLYTQQQFNNIPGTDTAQNTGEQTQTPPVVSTSPRPTQVISNEGGMIPNENPQDTQDSGSSGSEASDSPVRVREAREKIKNLKLTDAYSKYKEKIKVATATAKSEAERQMKKDFVALTESLKDLYKNYKNASAVDKNKIRSAIAKKIVEMMKGRVGYTDGWANMYNSEHFMAPNKMACTHFVALIAYITGNTNGGGEKGHECYWPPDKMSNYKLADNYTNSTRPPQAVGCSDLAYNRTVLSRSTIKGQQGGQQIGINHIRNMLKNKDIDALNKLQGKVLMTKWKFDKKPDSSSGNANGNFKHYSHTVIIGPYNPDTGKITVYESNSPDGVKVKEYSLYTFSNYMQHADVYEFNN